MRAKARRTRRKISPARTRQTLDAQLAQLDAAQLVQRIAGEDATYKFKHALTQDAAYESLLHTQRREIHRRVAQAYEAQYGEQCLDDYAGILANHYAQAGDDEQALLYATHAGDLAARVYANIETIAYYTQAIDAAKRIHATSARLIYLYTRRGRVFEVMGQNGEALSTYMEMYEFAHTQGDRALELEALLLQGKLYSIPSITFNRDKALEIAERVDTLARALDNRQAQVQSLWNRLVLCLYDGALPEALRYGEQALALARELEARELLGYILGDLGRAYLQAGGFQKGTALTLEAQKIWRETENKPMLVDNLMQSGALAMLRGDYEQTLALTDEALEIGTRIGSKSNLMSSLGSRIVAYLDLGEFAQALQLIQSTLAVVDQMDSGSLPVQTGFAALVYGFIGALDRGDEMARRTVAHLNQSIPEFFRAYGWSLLAQYYLVVAKVDAAVSALTASQIENHPERIDPAHLFGGMLQGECLVAQGEYGRAIELMENRMTMLRQIGIQQTMQDMLFIEAKAMRALGQTEQAIERLHQARRVSEEMQARRLLWQIYTILSEIEMERGNSREANNFRDKARENIGYIAAHTPVEFRAGFLDLPSVRKVML